MKAIKTAGEKAYNILFKTYSTDILGYKATLDGCGHFLIINSIYKDMADEISDKLIDLSNQNFRNFILLQKSGNAYMTDDLNFLEKSDAE